MGMPLGGANRVAMGAMVLSVGLVPIGFVLAINSPWLAQIMWGSSGVLFLASLAAKGFARSAEPSSEEWERQRSSLLERHAKEIEDAERVRRFQEEAADQEREI